MAPPSHYREWVKYMTGHINAMKSPQLGNVFGAVDVFFKRQIRSRQTSEKPDTAAMFDKLPLPHMTPQAVQMLINFLYNGRFPVLDAGHANSLINFCYLQSLAVQLEVGALANYCISVLSTHHIQLMQYDVAIEVMRLVARSENSEHIKRLRKLILDMLVCVDAPYITGSVLETMQAILGQLDRTCAVYVAKASTKRAHARNLSLALKQEDIPVTEIKAERNNSDSTEYLPKAASNELENDCIIPFHDAHKLCTRYHLHKKGQDCFHVHDSTREVDDVAEDGRAKRQE